MVIYVSVRVVSVAVKEIFVHMDTHLSNDRQGTLHWRELHVDLLVLYQQRQRIRVMWFMLHVLCS